MLTLLLDNNQIVELALPFGTVPALVSTTGLTTACQMERVQTISAAGNKLEIISEEMGLVGGSLASLSLANNQLTSISAIRDLKDKKLKHLNVEDNPIADKKVLKLLNGSRPEAIIKELLKYLQKEGGGGKKIKK